MLDRSLLEDARTQAETLLELEREMEHAKAEYHHMIRRLHLAGGSFREVGAALGLSHQRVGQIVAEGSRSWLQRWRDSRASSNRLRCSFCQRSDKDVAKLVAGPGVYICDDCVAANRRVLDAPDAPDGQAGSVAASSPLQRVPPGDKRRCAFCGKGSHSRQVERAMAGTSTTIICETCIGLAEGFVAPSA